MWKKFLKGRTPRCKQGRGRQFWERTTSVYILLVAVKPIHLEPKESSCWRKAVISSRKYKTNIPFLVIQLNKTHCCPVSVKFLLHLMSQVQGNPGPHSEVWRAWGWQVSVSWLPVSTAVDWEPASSGCTDVLLCTDQPCSADQRHLFQTAALSPSPVGCTLNWSS